MEQEKANLPQNIPELSSGSPENYRTKHPVFADAVIIIVLHKTSYFLHKTILPNDFFYSIFRNRRSLSELNRQFCLKKERVY